MTHATTWVRWRWKCPRDSTYAEDENVTPGVRYCYRLAASNDGGEGEQSAEGMRSASVTVTAVTVGKPTGLTVTAVSETSISLSWRRPGGRWRRAIGRLQRVPLCGRRLRAG